MCTMQLSCRVSCPTQPWWYSLALQIMAATIGVRCVVALLALAAVVCVTSARLGDTPACATGYTGPLCAACATGYQCISSQPNPIPPPNDADCASATEKCVPMCAPGYTGPLCSECATGYCFNAASDTCVLCN